MNDLTARLIVLVQSARELTAATWGHDLARALTRCDSIIEKISAEGSDSSAEYEQTRKLATRLKMSMQDVWKEAATDVFDVGCEHLRHDFL